MGQNTGSWLLIKVRTLTSAWYLFGLVVGSMVVTGCGNLPDTKRAPDYWIGNWDTDNPDTDTIEKLKKFRHVGSVCLPQFSVDHPLGSRLREAGIKFFVGEGSVGHALLVEPSKTTEASRILKSYDNADGVLLYIQE